MRDLSHAPCRALVTIVPPKPNREGETLLNNLKNHGVPVFNTLIRRSIGFQKAALAGVPLREMTGRDRLAWIDYEALGKEIMVHLNNVDKRRPNAEPTAKSVAQAVQASVPKPRRRVPPPIKRADRQARQSGTPGLPANKQPEIRRSLPSPAPTRPAVAG